MGSSRPKDLAFKYLNGMGDSITFGDRSIALMNYLVYLHRTQVAVNTSGAGLCRARNFGKASDTTTQMLARFAPMLTPVPTVAVIYGGINDQKTSIDDATTQANLGSMIDQLRNVGCNRIVLCSIHTINDVTESNYDAKRTAIQSVVTAKGDGVVLCDFHAVALVGADYQPDNLHLTATGQQKLADKLKSVLDAQGWTVLLQA